MKVTFLTLKIFSSTGGIEKVCRIVGKVLADYSFQNDFRVSILSMHDSFDDSENKYFPTRFYKTFSGNKIFFGIAAIREGFKSKVVILSHINLLIFGAVIKFISPSSKLFLFVHGIEVWTSFPNWKKRLLKKCDSIICVSNFTKKKIIVLHGVDEVKCVVINNCLDPYLSEPTTWQKSRQLMKKYGINEDSIVLFTMSRLSAHDRDKGYERVIVALSALKGKFPNLVYLIAGKYDEAEKEWLDRLTEKNRLEKEAVIFTGYVPEDKFAEYFVLSDIYIMPSIKEGFGIIFIEAMFYNKPVIGGNVDGSIDALKNGNFGILVNPFDDMEISNAIKSIILNQSKPIPSREDIVKAFGYDNYRNQLLHALDIS